MALSSVLKRDSVAQAVERKYGKILHDCSLSADKTRAACIYEAPMIPPDVVSVNLEHGSPVSEPIFLTRLNPECDIIELGDVSTLTWSEHKENGARPKAGVVLPIDYEPGKRYPLVVMLYNEYSAKEFLAQTPTFNYPVQVFAGHGYAVLIANEPEGSFNFEPRNFNQAKAMEVDGMVTAIRSAVDLLVERGIVDSKRMGIMGWSYGSFYTDYIVTHYPDWFQAAASGEGGTHNPSSFWSADVYMQQETDFYGGGPYGQYWSRWKEIAPVLNVDKMRAPLLMEYTAINQNGIEMRSAILAHGGQTELVIYPDDEHVFVHPLNRYISMKRHFDWFNFWLLGEEDSDPAKRDQYHRWRLMREKLTNRKLPTGDTSARTMTPQDCSTP